MANQKHHGDVNKIPFANSLTNGPTEKTGHAKSEILTVDYSAKRSLAWLHGFVTISGWSSLGDNAWATFTGHRIKSSNPLRGSHSLLFGRSEMGFGDCKNEFSYSGPPCF